MAVGRGRHPFLGVGGGVLRAPRSPCSLFDLITSVEGLQADRTSHCSPLALAVGPEASRGQQASTLLAIRAPIRVPSTFKLVRRSTTPPESASTAKLSR